MTWKLMSSAAQLIIAAAVCASSPALAAPEPADTQNYGRWGFDLAGRNVTVKPGDDFFAFANGTYIDKLSIPADRSWYGTVNVLRDLSEKRVRLVLEDASGATPAEPAAADIRGKVGAFYKAYMNEAAANALDLKPLRPELDAVRNAGDRAQLAALMGRAPKSFMPSLFDLGIFPDLKDSDKYAVYVSQGSVGLPDRDYYLDKQFVAKKQAYQAYAAKMLGMIGWPDPAANAQAIVNFETKVAEVSWTKAQQREVDKLYNPMSIPELQTMAPDFDWKGWLAPVALGGRPQVIAATNTSLPKIAAIYAATPLDVLKAFTAFHLADNAASSMSSRFVDASFDFNGRTLQGLEAQPDRWKRAVRATGDAMGEAIGQVYVKKYFPPKSKAQMSALVDNLKAAYRVRIGNLAWMSPATRAKALDKLNAMDIQIGYPTKWRDYSNLTVRADDLFGNRERALEWGWDYYYSRLDLPVDHREWDSTPQTVNAFNNGLANQLVFPAAILQAPVFSPSADAAVNYGAIGAVIGHEISHGFDDQGRKFDSRGHLTDWWTPADAAHFIAASKDYGGQYERFPIFPDAHIKGDLTMGENIADLAGILAALDAYHASLKGKPAPVIDGLTGDQRFFLAYAQYYRNKWREDAERQGLVSDPHSPDRARVDVVLPNVDAWYKAWKVKPGDKMYLPPEQRVRIW